MGRITRPRDAEPPRRWGQTGIGVSGHKLSEEKSDIRGREPLSCGGWPRSTTLTMVRHDEGANRARLAGSAKWSRTRWTNGNRCGSPRAVAGQPIPLDHDSQSSTRSPGTLPKSFLRAVGVEDQHHSSPELTWSRYSRPNRTISSKSGSAANMPNVSPTLPRGALVLLAAQFRDLPFQVVHTLFQLLKRHDYHPSNLRREWPKTRCRPAWPFYQEPSRAPVLRPPAYRCPDQGLPVRLDLEFIVSADVLP